MAYQVLARKWRPQDFVSLVGQQPIVTALRNALREDRVAQAYLFSGIRGVGKTTAARVLAKALNCENGPAENPCNACSTCREISAGSDLDVLEIDAATYSKVEQVRELAEGLRYGPARDRYKVVVLDEIHRLSRAAFDALLKIVEEPPAHLKFIFATTEIEAVPATILSRCQEFHFQRVGVETLAQHLRLLCDHEKIVASDSALRLLARAGEGSVRDSVALLDQLATYGDGEISDRDAVRMLGGLDTALFYEALEAILATNRQALVALVARIEDNGWDPRSVFAQFLRFVREALHLVVGGDPERVELPREERDRLAHLATAAGPESLLRILHLLLGSEPLVRRTEASALAIELAWLRAAELPKLVAIESLLAGAGGLEPLRVDHSRLAASASAPQGGMPAAPEAGTKAKPAAAPTAAVPDSVASELTTKSKAKSTSPRSAHGDVLALAEQRKPALAAHLLAAQLVWVGQTLRIEIPTDDPFFSEALERHRGLLDELVAEAGGEGAVWMLAKSDGAPPPDGTDGKDEAAANPPETPAEALAAPRPRAAPERKSRRSPATAPPRADSPSAEDNNHPIVQAVLEIFPGSLESVSDRD